MVWNERATNEALLVWLRVMAESEKDSQGLVRLVIVSGLLSGHQRTHDCCVLGPRPYASMIKRQASKIVI